MATRFPSIGKCWDDIWDTDAWTLYVWEVPTYIRATAPGSRTASWASLVKMHDAGHDDAVEEYRFSRGVVKYDKPLRRR